MTYTKKEWNALCERRVNLTLPACGGMETPFTTRSGVRLLYCYNPYEDAHFYINCDTDLRLTDEEAHQAINPGDRYVSHSRHTQNPA